MAYAAEPSLDLAEEADLQFEQGVNAYRSRDYLGALEHLLASNRLVANKNVVFNIARAYEQLGRYAEAYRHYADYREAETDPARRAGAEEALARLGPSVALVRIESDPPGASVFVDRVDLGSRGVTPRVLALEPGPHTVILRRDNYYEGTLGNAVAVIGQERDFRVQLEPVLGDVQLSGKPAGAVVRIDAEGAEPVGSLPGSFRLSPGAHMLIVEAPGHRTARQLVQVEENGTVQAVVELALVTGTVVVDAIEKGALIEIDGEAAGFTPAVLASVPAGEHRLRVSLPGYRAYEAEIQVSADGRLPVTATLLPLQEVTAASRTTQSVEDAPASVSLISAEEIRAFGYESIFDALGGTRGIFQSNDRVYEYIGVRGFALPGDYNNRTLLTLDGHALNDDQLGASYVGYDFASDLGDVERIEVVRGPGSALYGSNAFFGVINVVTRQGESMRPSHVAAGAAGAGLARGRASASGKWGDDGGFWLSAGGVAAQGENFSFAEFEAAEGDGDSVNADGFWSAGARGKAWKGDWTASAYGNFRDKRIPTGSFETILADDRAHSADGRAFAELRFEPELSPETQIFTRAYVDRYDFSGAYPYTDDLIEDSWQGTWFGAEARVVSAPVAWFRVTGGSAVDVHPLAQLTGQDSAGVYLDERPNYQVVGAYAVTEFDAGKALTLSAGARLDWFSTVGVSVNPRAAVVVRPAEDHTLKLLVGRAFRAPSPYELYYNDDGVTQEAAGESLAPETILTGEAEYTWRFQEIASLVVSTYYNRIDGLIDLGEQENGVLVYANTEGVVQTVGSEVELRRDWRAGWMASATAGAQLTRQGEDFSGKELTNSPAFTGAIKASAPLLPGQVNGASRLRLESGRLTDEAGQTEPFILWDLMVTGVVPAFHLDWALGVKNVLDWRYRYPSGDDVLMPSLPQPARSLYADVRVTF